MRRADAAAPSGPATGDAARSGGGLTIEAIVAVDPPREFRVHPRDRAVAYTADVGGARQLFTLSLRGSATPVQITASEQSVGDPQWSPDGRRLAFVRDGEIWVVEADGSRLTKVVAKPGGGRDPRWSPDGHRLAFLSRRRGWSQVWIIDAPVPRRGRPQRDPRPPEATAVTATGIDVDSLAWSPDGSRLVVGAQLRAEDLETHQLATVDIASSTLQVIAGEESHDTGATWMPDGSIVFTSDADGWFQVVRRTPDGRDRIVLTADEREHGEPSGGPGYAPIPSPDGSRLTHIAVHDGLIDLVVRSLEGGAPPKRGRGRPPKTPRTVVAGAGAPVAIQPWDGVWRAVGWLPDGAWVAAVGESETRPQDLWLLPVPGVAPDGSRPRQVTESRPAVLGAALTGARVATGERVTVKARDGLRLQGTLWRPPSATGKRGGQRVPTIIYPHGGPTWQAYRSFQPFKLLLAREGWAFLDVDFRGSTGYGRDFRRANHDEWGHADVFDIVDAARWVREQSWSDGRLAIFGGSYGGYLVLCALVEEPDLWSAGVDLYGDSEIAESFRHGDRIGRLDLQRQMGTPDDPARAASFRRGSPVYRAERIEAPLLILHGRKDKRVVPLMTERMVEALEIEDKVHEVHWYDDEGHGWERRENRRDAYERILTFLRTHVPPSGSSG